MTRYDYIIAGAGAAGLSLLVHMIQSGKFNGKRILLVDKDPKTSNDRTWCFWETRTGPFEEVVYKSWSTMQFFGADGTMLTRDISPYRYKLIRGIDFYSYCLRIITSSSNIEVLYGTITDIQGEEDSAYVEVNGERMYADFVFSSILMDKPERSKGVYMLLQHFRGWVIKTTYDFFDPSTATLMDFRAAQHHGTTFFYVMPFAAREALVEYTLFSPALLPEHTYEDALRQHITKTLHLDSNSYQVVARETGSIPMTNYHFRRSQGRLVYIGTAGGQTKPSSGYTFSFIQKDSSAIVRSLIGGTAPIVRPHRSRFHFYDSVLLNILESGKMDGAYIFSRLFNRNSMQKIFRFLDNDTNIVDELGILSSLPAITFSRAAIEHLALSQIKKSPKP